VLRGVHQLEPGVRLLRVEHVVVPVALVVGHPGLDGLAVHERHRARIYRHPECGVLTRVGIVARGEHHAQVGLAGVAAVLLLADVGDRDADRVGAGRDRDRERSGEVDERVARPELSARDVQEAEVLHRVCEAPAGDRARAQCEKVVDVHARTLVLRAAQITP
jgi:hypothetical protein